MLTVTKAFYYISLEIGNILIGWLGTIIYMTLAFLCATFAKQDNREFTLAVILGSLAIICIIQVFGCILLAVGVMKKSHLLILPWLFGQILIIFVSLLITIGILVYFEIWAALCINAVLTVWILSQLYLWICVYSMYEKIEYTTNNKKYASLRENASFQFDRFFVPSNTNSIENRSPQAKIADRGKNIEHW